MSYRTTDNDALIAEALNKTGRASVDTLEHELALRLETAMEEIAYLEAELELATNEDNTP